MTWRLAKSLEVLRQQINQLYPNRSKASDGTIGDEAHSSRTSDHNPDATGTVCAIDFTNDPEGGLSCAWLAATLVANKDKRIKYLIWNGKIVSSEVSPWVWRKYNGANQHTKHIHISVNHFHDEDDPWDLGSEAKDNGKELQIILNLHGAGLVVDGIVGPKTKTALEKYKADYNTIIQLEKSI